MYLNELTKHRWRHADGGVYRVIGVKGQIRQTGSNAWEPVVIYDHDDGTQSFGPYYTGWSRFMDRFDIEPSSPTI